MRLADIAPRLARARDQWVEEQAMLAALRRQVGWHLPGPPTCPVTGKVLYPDRSTARQALAQLQVIPERRVCRIYRCEFCGAWHLTSKPFRRPTGQRAAA